MIQTGILTDVTVNRELDISIVRPDDSVDSIGYILEEGPQT